MKVLIRDMIGGKIVEVFHEVKMILPCECPHHVVVVVGDDVAPRILPIYGMVIESDDVKPKEFK